MKNNSQGTTNTESRILAGFFFLCGLLTNKYLVEALYSSRGTITTTWVNGVLWLDTAFWILVGILAWMNRLARYRVLANTLFAIAISASMFEVLAISDRALLPLMVNIPEKESDGLIFEPHSSVRFETSEYKCIALVNRLGIRDHEYSLSKQKKYRILAFGDSFTFGLGVNIDDAWPKVLESKLGSMGIDAEVLNCGEPGIWSKQYREYAEKAVPLLKPDLVIVGLWQQDDLLQKLIEMVEMESSNGGDSLSSVQGGSRDHRFDIGGFVERFPKLAFKNMYILIEIGQKSRHVSVREEWLKESREILHRWTGRTKLRYDMVVSDSVKMLFESGNLNPYLVAIGVEHPDDITIADIQNPRSRRGIAGLESDLRVIRSVCIREHSDLMIISIPGAPYVNRDAVKYREMGFILPDEVLPGNEMDSLFGTLARHIGASFLGFTDLFRQKSASSMLFYRFDGHFTALGHHLLGDSLGSFLVKNYFH